MTSQSVYIVSCIILVICAFLSLIAGKKKKVKNIKLPVTETVFPVSAGITEPVFFDALEGICKNKPIKFTDIKWKSENYENKVGEYIFKPISPSGYKLEDISIKVKVVDNDCLIENDGNFEINNAAITNKEASFDVYDLTGCNLIESMPGISQNVDIIDNVNILGGYIYNLRVKSDTVISTGTFGNLAVENGASLTVTDKAEIQTLVINETKKIDITSHYGNIGNIIQNQTTTVKYFARNANQLLSHALPVDTSSIVIGKNEYKGVIVDIISDIGFVTVKKGTPVDQIPLPKTLKVLTAMGETEPRVKWHCENYSDDENVYKFVPLFDDYVVSDSVDTAEFTVISALEGAVKAEIIGMPEKTVLTEMKECAELSVNAFCILGENIFNIKLSNVKFIFDETNSAYVLDKASVDPIFDINDVSIYAEFVKKDVYKENKLEIDSIKIKIDADKTGVMSITDIAGIQTFATNVTEINKIRICGNCPELEINTLYAKINGEICVSDIGGVALINTHSRYVSKIRYSADIADKIAICGVPATEYLNRSPLQFKKTFFANGIPVIIRQNQDGETYVYRANDLTKISSAITGGVVFGGAYKSDIESTNVTFESGVLFEYYGGSEQGNIYGEVYCAVTGGLVTKDWMGGSSNSDYCEKIICVFEKGEIKCNWFGGGSNSVVGVPGKVYADNKYAIELYIFDGIFTNFIYGVKSDCGRNVFGNIRLEKSDGVGINIRCGNKGEVTVVKESVEK